MKLLKRLLIGLLVLAALIYFVAIPYLHKETKKFSPARTATMDLGGSNLEVDYSSPTKKDRVVFGNLVPYDEVWRTGANEPTTFSNSNQIKIIDKMLPAGTYSLWTIPNKESWKIIFNTEVPNWGVTRVNGNQTTHEAQHDYLTVEVPVVRVEETIEEFSIIFEEEVQNQKTQHYLTLSWDTIKIKVPINK
jgi:methionine-rich copper-binding protein CopC